MRIPNDCFHLLEIDLGYLTEWTPINYYPNRSSVYGIWGEAPVWSERKPAILSLLGYVKQHIRTYGYKLKRPTPTGMETLVSKIWDAQVAVELEHYGGDRIFIGEYDAYICFGERIHSTDPWISACEINPAS